MPSLAARFAAREAVMKALGFGLGAFGFHDVWVERRGVGRAALVVTSRARELADDAAWSRWHLSLSHTGRSRWPTSSPSETRLVTSACVIPIVTPEEMAAIDNAAPEPVEVLIERAGSAVARSRRGCSAARTGARSP